MHPQIQTSPTTMTPHLKTKNKRLDQFLREEEEEEEDPTCSNPRCFFCTMKQSDPTIRSSRLAKCFEEMPLRDDEEHVLVLSGLWNIAMTHSDDPEFPSLGVFECMASFIHKALTNPDWLLKDQNIYIPYYAAHIIGSYTMNKPEFAEKAVKSGVVPPLLDLLRGKLTWVEQRVAVRALGHLASYDRTFQYVAKFETQVVELSMNLASTCLDVVYTTFIRMESKERKSRRLVKYQCDLLTRGVIGGAEMENRKAEEWASQIQCWSISLLNCFAMKNLPKSMNLICNKDNNFLFLKDLCAMWGGLTTNQSSPAGFGLIRILCYSKTARRSIAESKQVVQSLCNLSRSSDDWQYIGIDCLLLLLQDPETKSKVIGIAAPFLADLIEIRALRGRTRVGDNIARSLLYSYKSKSNVKDEALMKIWDLKIERRSREGSMSSEELKQRWVSAELLKQEGNERFWCGEADAAMAKYTDALELCPMRMRKERVVLYSNRAQCHLLVRNADAAISDCTRALSLCNPVNSHAKSLWRRSQAYDMKGMAKESLMDCIVFVDVNGRLKTNKNARIKVPYYAARMISKQMSATWLFSAARSKVSFENVDNDGEIDGSDESEEDGDYAATVLIKTPSWALGGLATILEEPLTKRSKCRRRKLERTVWQRRRGAGAAPAQGSSHKPKQHERMVQRNRYVIEKNLKREETR
ncbi:hypothetical protein Sjap_022740 [Stephania japonica]|uniref:ARM repeat N-terminal plant domain-containing protein n=1 Tax=Stephania japonica TaxID=461633 RepID=A0AAP0HQ55_9MAGN